MTIRGDEATVAESELTAGVSRVQLPEFLPDTLNEWMGAAAIIVAWIVTMWKAWDNVIGKINGLGGRVGVLEASGIDREARLRKAEQSADRTAQDNVSIHERLARGELALENIREDLTDMRIDIISAINKVGQDVTERDAATRERIARIEGSGGHKHSHSQEHTK